jgi:hypothetical protein
MTSQAARSLVLAKWQKGHMAIVVHVHVVVIAFFVGLRLELGIVRFD